jgi:uncharacterized protein YqeY
MKTRQVEKTQTLRLVKAALINLKVEKNKEWLAEDEVIQVIRKQVKQRRESMESFSRAGRKDLERKEAAEAAILEAYLPPAPGEAEIEEVVRQVIADLSAASPRDGGRVIKEAVSRLRGSAEGRLISQVVKRLLG